MKSALIGYTGFVGSNILNAQKFDDLYNSKNIGDIVGKDYDLVVSSATWAEKWKINQDPEADQANIKILTDALSRVTTKQLVLISTVDVYPSPVGADEDSIIDMTKQHPYGKHRLELEVWAREHFPTLVIRLPGLFGQGLKKNIIFDLLNRNMIEAIDARGSFQFYNLDHVWKDISIALEHNLQLVNFATEPVTAKVVAEIITGKPFDQVVAGKEPARYDFRSRHAQVFGGQHGYLYSKAQILQEITDFAERSQ